MAGLRQQVLERSPWGDVTVEDVARAEPITPCFCKPKVDRDRFRANIEDTVRREIIPRLLARRSSDVVPLRPRASDGDPPAVTTSDIDNFADILLTSQPKHTVRYIETKHARGLPLESVYLDLLAPTARRLGDLWQEDLCDFCEVTIAVCHLHRIVRDFSPTFLSAAPRPTIHRTALLAPCSGEQHTFGIYMVAEFFRRAGWTVSIGRSGKARDLVEVVRNQWFAVIGLSLSCDSRVDELAATINAVRRASRNPLIRVLVGGRVFNDHSDLVHLVGADGTAFDGRHAMPTATDMEQFLPATP